MKQMQIPFTLITAALTFLCFSCNKSGSDVASETAFASRAAKGQEATESNSTGYVYTLSNETSGNRVLAYSRSSAGTLTYATAYPTGGNGTGGGLGSQGAVTLSEDNKILLAVNAGSNSVTSFAVSGGTLTWISTIASGGIMPVSITVHGGLVYVLNGGGSGNISGFTLNEGGVLHPLANSTRPLSSSAAGAAQVSFAQDGAVLVVTEKVTNKIISYTVNSGGTPGMMHKITAANATPFGFAVGKKGMLYVSEAAGGAPGASTVSLYHVGTDGMISLIKGPVAAGQTAACWVVLTNNEKYVYATNTGSNNLSSFTASAGMLSLLGAAVASREMSAPLDAALSNNSKFLYVLNSGTESITALSVSNDGSLHFLQDVAGLPDGSAGLAAK